MKGIILAGGTATRLFPLTATTSKQLLPVYDRQMIFYPLNTLVQGGVREILMIVAPEHSGQFLNLLGSLLKNHGIQIYFEVQKVPRGLPEAFVIGESFIDGDSVAMILGDNIFEDNFSETMKGFKGGAHIFLKKVSDPERFGVASFDDQGRVIEVVEKPEKYVSDHAIVGFYIYDETVSEAAKKLAPSKRKETEITDLHRHYLNNKQLRSTVIGGAWLDAGTYDSLLEAGSIVKERGMHKNFHPAIESAIAEFNNELKNLAKKKLV
ncbi:spore coat protein [Patescibacteria group bacterium]|nr:MAG: spore coat protein [Patescibacteria group bacterium]